MTTQNIENTNMESEEFDPFAIMQTQIQAQIDNNGKGGYESGSIEKPEWFGLTDKSYTAFRIIGNPFEARTKPWHSKIVLVSDILTDKGFAIPFIWESEKDENGRDTPNIDKDFFLFRLYTAIAKYKWDENTINPKTGKAGIKVFQHLDTDAGKRFINNYTDEEMERARLHNFSMERNFLPTARVILPVWVDNDKWCKENNHTKILTPKYEKWEKNGKSGYNTDYLKAKTIGVPYKGFYTLISKNVVGFHGHWDIDILAFRDSRAIKSGEPTYAITDATDNRIINQFKLSVNANRLDKSFVDSLNHYDLDNMIQFKRSSYHMILKHLEKGIKLVDATLDTNFHEEIKSLVADEKAKWEENKKDKDSNSATTVVKPESKPVQVQEESQQQTKTEPPKGRVKVEVNSANPEPTIREMCSKIYKFWDTLDEREQDATINAIDRFENNIPVMKSDAHTAMCGEDCKYPDGSFVYTDESISKCPACGAKYR